MHAGIRCWSPAGWRAMILVMWCPAVILIVAWRVRWPDGKTTDHDLSRTTGTVTLRR